MGNRESRYINSSQTFITDYKKSLTIPRSSDESENKTLNDNSKYAIPNTTEGIHRLTVQHYLIRYLWQSNFESPVHNLLSSSTTSKVLDLGCGVGTWCIEIASEYPNAQITGVDITSFFPTSPSENVKFLAHNFPKLKKLPFADNEFDFVHMRFLAIDILEEDYELGIKELVRVTKPGGWIEICEWDLPFFSYGVMTKRLTDALMGYLKSHGYNPQITTSLPQYLKETGQITIINEHEKAIPLGHWAKSVGNLALEDITTLFKNMKEHLIKHTNMTEKEYEKLIEEYKEEVEENRTFFKVKRFFTQKVGGAESNNELEKVSEKTV